MIRRWSIWPYHPDDPETLDRAWKYDLENGVIAIGWNLGSDVVQLTYEALSERLLQLWPDELTAPGMVWRFYHEVVPGDTIVAVRRRREFVGVGTVVGPAFYDDQRGKQRVGSMRDYKANFLPVRWLRRGSWIAKTPLPRQTVAELSEEKYLALA
jgi:predicted Mrr-cat superfamily restriction endonuclease